MRGGPGTADAERIVFTNVTMANVLLRAYDVKILPTKWSRLAIIIVDTIHCEYTGAPRKTV